MLFCLTRLPGLLTVECFFTVHGGFIADTFKHCGMDTKCMIITLLPASRRADSALRVAGI